MSFRTAVGQQQQQQQQHTTQKLRVNVGECPRTLQVQRSLCPYTLRASDFAGPPTTGRQISQAALA